MFLRKTKTRSRLNDRIFRIQTATLNHHVKHRQLPLFELPTWDPHLNLPLAFHVRAPLILQKSEINPTTLAFLQVCKIVERDVATLLYQLNHSVFSLGPSVTQQSSEQISRRKKLWSRALLTLYPYTLCQLPPRIVSWKTRRSSISIENVVYLMAAIKICRLLVDLQVIPNLATWKSETIDALARSNVISSTLIVIVRM